MYEPKAPAQKLKKGLPKTPSGIVGLDEVTDGGLPRGRTTLVCGGAGCGKTILAMEFLLNGALDFDEPGVFISFEETTEDLAQNITSLGYHLNDLVARKKIVVDHVRIDRREIYETGEYDLDGLLVRLDYAINSIGAKRVALDTIETLFSDLPNEAILRAELRRLFGWLKDRGVTAIITAERGEGTLTRHGLEEYVSDCVILLDHRVNDQLSTRRLRIVKYRGSSHGSNEYPFLIDHDGISVLPITSLGLAHRASTERVSSGIPQLDQMLGSKGYYQGSSVLITGTAGTGKTTLAALFANAACARGEQCLYLASEESPSQLLRNLRSVGLDLGRWVKKGLLHFQAARPTAHGLEMHLALAHKAIIDLEPQVVILDPVTNLLAVGDQIEVKAMLMRLVDFMKEQQITALFTSLTDAEDNKWTSEIGISSLMDTWILLRMIEANGERNRGIFVLKSRGMAHSNQIREYKLSDRGINVMDAYLGPDGVLTGTARFTQEAREKAEAVTRQQGIEQKRRVLDNKRRAMEIQINALRADFQAQLEELENQHRLEDEREEALGRDRAAMARLRYAELNVKDQTGESNDPPIPKKTRKKGAKNGR
jgi:circadian clock protein KaiC